MIKTLIIFLNRFLWSLIVGIVLLIGLYLSFLWAMNSFNYKFLEMDQCRDSGGGWNDESKICEYKE